MIGLLFCLYFSPGLMLAPGIILPPIVFLISCCFLLFSSKFRKTAIYGLVAYDFFFIVGSLVILTDDGSTAGVGFIFLPVISLVPGVIACVFHCIFSINKNNAS
jgi:hypothetical protein